MPIATQTHQPDRNYPVTGQIVGWIEGNPVISMWTWTGWQDVLLDVDECRITSERVH